MDENGQLVLDTKLTDFGWSVVNHGARSTVCGTKSYMAPEILNANLSHTGYSYEAESYACMHYFNLYENGFRDDLT